MAELKTKPTNKDVYEFIHKVTPEWKCKDSHDLIVLMSKITGNKPVMWGDTIVGFGDYHYKYASGREGDWFLTGFSPRKQNMTVYLMCDFDGAEDILQKIGKHKKSVGCLYFKRLDDLDIEVLEQLIGHAVNRLKERYKRDK